MAIDINKLEDSPHLLDVLLQMEDVLDSLDLWVFPNWFDGVLAAGPEIHRHSLGMTLLYPYKSMPDPRAITRLMAQGIRVTFREAEQESTSPGRTVAQQIEGDKTDSGDGTDVEAKAPTNKVWLVDVAIPRRLITEMNAGSLEAYDDEIDRDDVEDAQDTGATEETGFTTDGQEDDSTGGGESADDEAEQNGEGAARV